MNKLFCVLSLSVALSALVRCSAQQTSKKIEIDLLITGATVFDGTGQDSARLDIGVTGERIVYVEKHGKKLPSHKKQINANGLYLAPGFIDPHTHVETDLSSEKRKSNLAYLMQGVTTVFAGNDGTSPLPIGEKLKKWEESGIGTNAGLFVGHGSVRKIVLGDADISPRPAELEAMKNLVGSSMNEGAFGLSTGLFYAPGSFAHKEEVVELAKIAARNGGIYDTHLRDESSYTIGLVQAVQEALDIGKQAAIPVHISHIKALGADVWGKSDEIITMIEKARTNGVTVTANQYPYNASRTSLIAAVIPRWAEDGGYENLLAQFDNQKMIDSLQQGIADNIRRRGGAHTLLFSGTSISDIENKSLEQVAQAWGINPIETIIKILKQDKNVRVVSFNMQDSDLEKFTKQPWVMTGSDGTPGHPRKYGTFPRRIREYVLTKKCITMAFAIHASSGLTANTLGIKERGFIKKGYYADLVLFNPNQLQDLATFENPDVLAKGMEYVLVNGNLVIDKGVYTGLLAGKVLRLR